MGDKGEGLSGTRIKDTWTKPNAGRIKGGKWGCLRWGRVVGGQGMGKFLNGNKKNCEKKTLQIKFQEKMPREVNEQDLFKFMWRMKLIGVRGGFKWIQI